MYPETVLSSPLLTYDADNFIKWYSRSRYEGVDRQVASDQMFRLARSLMSKSLKPPVDLLTRHVPELTPALSHLGQTRMKKELCYPDLESSLSDVLGYERSLKAGIAGRLSEAERDWSGRRATHDATQVYFDNVKTYYLDAIYWHRVVEIGTVSDPTSPTWDVSSDIAISARITLVLLRDRWIVMTRNVTLMMRDMMMSRFITAVSCNYIQGCSDLLPLLSQYCSWADRTLLRYGNGAYTLLKAVEPLSKVRIIEIGEKLIDHEAQSRAMRQKFLEKESELSCRRGSPHGNSTVELWSILCSTNSADMIGEFFGFLKLSGHPYVDPVKGCVKSQKSACKKFFVDPRDCANLEWSFCHTYLRGYLLKKGEWPPLEFYRSSRVKSKLEELRDKGQPSLPLGMTMYPSSDWASCRFLPHQPFDMGEDILSLITDKSLSYKRSEFDCSWYGVLPYNPPMPTSSNRVLVELLGRETFNLHDICDTVSKRTVPDDWKVVTVSPKEREMKEDPRMFAMMVLEMRSFFVLLEHNITTGIFKYIPEQTMTLSRTELVSRLLEASQGPRKGWIRLSYEVDFTGWNLFWRDQTYGPIGNRIDQIYGTIGLYTYIHEFFETSLVNLRERNNPPVGLTSETRLNPPASETVWYGHEGGFEGIGQKPWTAATEAAIHMCLWGLGLSYNILGQGDNQVSVLDIPIPAGYSQEEVSTLARSTLDMVNKVIPDGCRKIGHEVKSDECIYSTCFITYGKELWFKGRYLSTVTKYLSRIFPSFSPDEPSLHTYLSTISSGGVAATEHGSDNFGCLLTTKFCESLFIRRELRFSILHGSLFQSELARLGMSTVRDDLMQLVLCVPPNLGGFPVSTPLEFLYRGHSDPLASSVASLSLFSSVTTVRRYLRLLSKDFLYDVTPDLSGLINDPYSVPLRGIESPGSAVARSIRDNLYEITVNSDIQELCLDPGSKVRECTIEGITKLKPVYPKVWSDLYSSSIAGVSEAFSRRFVNSRTLMAISRKAGIDIEGTSILRDQQLFLACLVRFNMVWKTTDNMPQVNQPALVREMRLRWGVGELYGVSNLNFLGVGHLHLVSGECQVAPEGCFQSGILLAISLSDTPSEARTVRGATIPFLGSTTSEKMVSRWVRPSNTSPPMRDLLKILTIRNAFCRPGDKPWLWIEDLARQRSLVPLEQAEPFLQVRTGGTKTHRYLMRDDERGSFLSTSPTWATHFTISSNLSGLAGSVDYSFSFAEGFVTLISLSEWLFRGTDDSTAPFGLEYCFELPQEYLVQDEMIELDNTVNEIEQVPRLLLQSYYSVVRDIVVSGRVHASSVLAPRSLFQYSKDSDLQSAVDNIVIRESVRPHPLYRYRSHTWSRTNMKSVLDLAEVSRIDPVIMTISISEAILFKCSGVLIASSRSLEKLEEDLYPTLESAARRVVPPLWGTLARVVSTPDLQAGHGLSQDDQRGIMAAWVQRSIRQSIKTLHGKVAKRRIYTYGTFTLSSVVYQAISTAVLSKVLSRVIPFQTAKLLRRFLARCLEKSDEMMRLWCMYKLLYCVGLEDLVELIDLPAESVTRELRISEKRIPVGSEPVSGCDHGLDPHRHTTEHGSTLELLLSEPGPFPRNLLVESWRMRPAPPESSSVHRWRCLRNLFPTPISVLLIGVGSGGIMECLSPGSQVDGLELASFLSTLGQDFPTYQPTHLGKCSFTLLQESWISSGDISDASVVGSIKGRIRSGQYDLVLIDIERTQPRERLLLRNELAQEHSSVKVAVRVLVSQEDYVPLLLSLESTSSVGDSWWVPDVGMGREVVVVGGRSPLGLFKSTDTTPPHNVCVLKPLQTSRETQEKALTYHLSQLGVIPKESEDGLDLVRTVHNRVRLGTDVLSLSDWMDHGEINITEESWRTSRSRVRNLVMSCSLLRSLLNAE